MQAKSRWLLLAIRKISACGITNFSKWDWRMRFVTFCLIAVISWVVANCDVSAHSLEPGTYTGSYTCGHGASATQKVTIEVFSQAQTGDDGRWSFSGVAAGSYTIKIQDVGDLIIISPGRWEVRPRGGYTAVGAGLIKTGNQLDGDINYDFCQDIHVQKLPHESSSQKASSDSGETLYRRGMILWTGNTARDSSEMGRRFPINKPLGARNFTLSCEAGFREACVFLARAYKRGDGVDQDLTSADIYFKRACALHFMSACDEIDPSEAQKVMGAVSGRGWNIAHLQLNYTQAELGDKCFGDFTNLSAVGAGCNNFAIAMGLNSDATSDLHMDIIVRALKRGCDLKVGYSCETLGNVYFGRTIAKFNHKDKAVAVNYYKTACSLGAGLACGHVQALESANEKAHRVVDRSVAAMSCVDEEEVVDSYQESRPGDCEDQLHGTGCKPRVITHKLGRSVRNKCGGSIVVKTRLGGVYAVAPDRDEWSNILIAVDDRVISAAWSAPPKK